MVLAIISCGKKEKPFNGDTRPSVIEVMTTPIYASSTSIEVYTTDYLLDVTVLDSITYGKGVLFNTKTGNATDPLKLEMDSIAPYVSHVSLWTDGIRNDIPVFTNTPRNLQTARLSYGEIVENGFTFKTNGELQNIVILYENQMISASQKGDTYIVELPEKDFSNRKSSTQLVRVYASDFNGRTNDLLIPVQNREVVQDPSQLARSEHHSQVIYSLMVDRFMDGDDNNTEVKSIANYNGGDLAGVLAKIKDGYFEELGINTISLSPITQNAGRSLERDEQTKFHTYQGNAPVSNTLIDKRYGDEELLKLLIEEAHNRDINVILDYVTQHVHEQNPIYKEHTDWVTSLYVGDQLHQLDFKKPEVVNAMTDTALYWVANYEMDGLRYDLTDQIPHVYWRSLNQKIRKHTNRPIYQLGESNGSYDVVRSYMNSAMLNAQMEFNQYEAAVDAFVKADGSYANLAQSLFEGLDYYGHHHLMGTMSGNQDRARFISYASGDLSLDDDGWHTTKGMIDTTSYDRLGMLQAFNMTVPGIPIIYYGDEYGSIGLGVNSPNNIKMMKFKDLSQRELDLKKLVSSLVNLRKNSMSLLYGTTQIVSEANGLLVLKRNYFDEETVVYFNENAISLNVHTKSNARDVDVITLNGLETEDKIQVKARNFAIVQTKIKESTQE